MNLGSLDFLKADGAVAIESGPTSNVSDGTTESFKKVFSGQGRTDTTDRSDTPPPNTHSTSTNTSKNSDSNLNTDKESDSLSTISESDISQVDLPQQELATPGLEGEFVLDFKAPLESVQLDIEIEPDNLVYLKAGTREGLSTDLEMGTLDSVVAVGGNPGQEELVNISGFGLVNEETVSRSYELQIPQDALTQTRHIELPQVTSELPKLIKVEAPKAEQLVVQSNLLVDGRRLNATTQGKNINELALPPGTGDAGEVFVGKEPLVNKLALKAPMDQDNNMVKPLVDELSRFKSVNGISIENKPELLSPEKARLALDKTSLAPLEEGQLVSTRFSIEQNQRSGMLPNDSARLQMPVNISFGRPEWAMQVADRAALMSMQKIQFAELRLDPPELGALQVRVSVNTDQQASVSFISPHASVREALDQSILKLRDLLEQQGVDLVDVNVSDQQQGFSQEQKDAQESSAPAEHSPKESGLEEVSQTVNTQYGVDFYA